MINPVVRACLLAALLLAPIGLRAQPAPDKPPEPAPAQTQPQTTTPPISVTVTGPIRVEQLKEKEPDWEKLQCGESKSHDEADLCEQRRMAAAAERTVKLNIWQIALSGGGFLLVGLSLWYLRQQTKATVLAANAARDAVNVATNTARHQLRAYLHPGSFKATWDRDEATGKMLEVRVEVPIINTGQTPAKKCVICAEIVYANRGEIPSLRAEVPRNWGSDIGAQNFTRSSIRSIPGTMMDALVNREKNAFFMLFIEYDDIFSVSDNRYAREQIKLCYHMLPNLLWRLDDPESGPFFFRNRTDFSLEIVLTDEPRRD